MKRLFFLLAATGMTISPSLVTAQTSAAVGNNPTLAGLYVGLGLGVSVLTDTDFENDEVDFEAESDVGIYGDLSLGYLVPRGPFSIRAEGELAFRANAVDEFGNADALNNSDISSIAGMFNAFLDCYVLPNTALTVGAGIGYATVQADIAVEVDDEDVLAFDEERDGSFAYQGMVGMRYDFSGGSTVEVGYTYFATGDLTAEFDEDAVDFLGLDDEDADFDYADHAFHVGYAYRF